jgi:pimeloyl-ACP methyl ester carboxylesterase
MLPPISSKDPSSRKTDWPSHCIPVAAWNVCLIVTTRRPPAATPTKATTDVLEIAFLQAGEGLDKVALLLHGWPDYATTWLSVAERLSRADIRTIMPWLRGFGQTRFLSASTCRDGRTEALAQDALDLMDALDLNVAMTLAGAGFVAAGTWLVVML